MRENIKVCFFSKGYSFSNMLLQCDFACGFVSNADQQCFSGESSASWVLHPSAPLFASLQSQLLGWFDTWLTHHPALNENHPTFDILLKSRTPKVRDKFIYMEHLTKTNSAMQDFNTHTQSHTHTHKIKRKS